MLDTLQKRTPDRHRLGLRFTLNALTSISLIAVNGRLNTSRRSPCRCCLVTIAALVLGVVLSTSRDAVAQSTFTSPDRILLLGDFGPHSSAPYPSALTVSGLAGTVSKVTATLTDLGGASQADLAFLLVGPNGQTSILMSGVRVNSGPLTLTFDDFAPSSMTNGGIASGTYKPSLLGLATFPPPAPTEPYGTTLSVFNGTSPNGEWKLYAVNLNLNVDLACVILGENCAGVEGWSLTITTTSSTPNQIDGAQFFVHQHYLDFLNREPDADGLAFWTNDIASCGTDQQCIEVKHINDSAAFYLSIEFQQTGYLVYRIYKASYGNLPGAPVPITRSEFSPDTQQIGQGVIVNQTGWEQIIESNKQAFTSEFVQRPRFISAYPTTMTPDVFADTLFANAGVMPSSTDRSAAINEFGFATTTADVTARSRALRRVAENSTLAQQEFNRAFVLMQYFGYLRRNPNDTPESGLNYDGYNFWLNKLDTFNGNYLNAEMVKAFIASAEYRQRFGP